MYYLCGENKGADLFRGYREADLRLCFAYAKVFSRCGSYYVCFMFRFVYFYNAERLPKPDILILSVSRMELLSIFLFHLRKLEQ